MKFINQLKTWLQSQRLNLPEDHNQDNYTNEVMHKIRVAETSSERSLQLGMPRLVLALGSVAAGVLMVVGVLKFMPTNQTLQLAQTVEEDAALLIALESLGEDAFSDDLLDTWVESLDEVELMTLAQSAGQDEQWLEQTLYLLEQFDEDISSDEYDSQTDEDWLIELELLDEINLAATS